jgi:hypothetical protein
MVQTTREHFSESPPQFNLLRGFSRAAAKQLGRRARSVSCPPPMGHCKGKDNVKKRAVRRKKTERLALAKSVAAAAK